MKIIAHIFTDFDEKFGIPRQSGLVAELRGRIVFEKEYRNPDALRGLEDYSYLWLLWQFSEIPGGKWSPLVRPPRLGGNQKAGVFATRSPFRPNPIGLSSVKIEDIVLHTSQGPVIDVSGVDLLNDTPIYDIKPYLPQVDAHPDAREGFSGTYKDYALQVDCSKELLAVIPKDKQKALLGVLAQDPRPGYQHEESRVYGIHFAGYNVKFTVKEDVLTVKDIQ
jgi:tRNA-Thr(GGU) m(6)t(6)A37 methyltransferase TsaA